MGRAWRLERAWVCALAATNLAYAPLREPAVVGLDEGGNPQLQRAAAEEPPARWMYIFNRQNDDSLRRGAPSCLWRQSSIPMVLSTARFIYREMDFRMFQEEV